MAHCNDEQSSTPCIDTPLLMADIADKLDPDVQAELKAAFLGIQKVAAALEKALLMRAELLETLKSQALAGTD